MLNERSSYVQEPKSHKRTERADSRNHPASRPWQGLSLPPGNLLDKLVPILYEDKELLAVGKPAGIDVGGTPSDQAVGLVELLQTLRVGKEKLYPANRLSRFESGVLLLGKSPGVSTRLRALIKSFQFRQEYVAVVHGRMKKPTLHLGDEGPRSGRSRTFNRTKTRTVQRPRPSTHAPRTVLQRLGEGEHRTLLRCETAAETTHALRAQLRSAGLRIVGDRLHDRSPRLIAHEDTCLHLARVELQPAGSKRPLIIRCPPPVGFAEALRGHRNVPRALQIALARRLSCLLDADTDSYRLLSGPSEGLPGLVAEKYGAVVVLQTFDPSPQKPEAILEIARWYRGLLPVRAVYVKRFVKSRTQLDDDSHAALRSEKPLLGEPVPEQIEIKERGLRFAIRPYDGFSVGLFLDQRDNRSRIREMSNGKDVLNLFAYTCSFSVAAAAGGASSTTSVDVSPKHLEWGRTNFALNGVDLTAHQFIRSDAADYLKRAKRQEKQFDIIVLDPPSFAHGRKSKHDFSILEDLSGLVASACELLRTGGIMMISTNHRKMSLRDILRLTREGFGSRPCEILATPALPPDFAVDPDHAKTVFVRCKSTRAQRPDTSGGDRS